MDIGEIISYLLNEFLKNINISYFVAMLILAEFVKQFTNHDRSGRKRWFKFDKKKRFTFRTKVIVFLLGLIVGFAFYWFGIMLPVETGPAILQLIITYALTTSMYDLFFVAIIKKGKEILRKIGKAKVKDIEIDVNQNDGYGGGYNDFGNNSFTNNEQITNEELSEELPEE